MVNTVFADLEHYSIANNVTLNATFHDDAEKLCVNMTQTHVRTIVQNIVENAIRYSFPGSTVEVSILPKGKFIQFDCTNSGMGIKKKDQQYIFSKFYRSRDAIQKQGDGTGLGLYVIYQLVKLYDGSIDFTSVPNKETTFTVLLKAYDGKK